MSLVGWDMAHDRRLNGWASIKCASGGIPEGRNQLAEALLKSDCEWLFMVDADMGFEPVALDQLLSIANPVDKPIVGGLAFAQREAFDDRAGGFRCIPRPTIFDWVQHEDGHWRFTGRSHYPTNTLIKCAATGGAFLVIHRTVFEDIKKEYGNVWFDRIRGTDESLIGEDISFFARCQALEIPCHVHTGVRTTHMKNLWLGEDDFWSSFLPPPADQPVDILVRGELPESFLRSLRASTGWASIHTDIEDCTADWVLMTKPNAQFRPAWYDHALDVARRYGPKVIGMNDLNTPAVRRGETAQSVLVDRQWLSDLSSVDVKSVVEAAQKQRVFMASMASEVDQPPMVANIAKKPRR